MEPSPAWLWSFIGLLYQPWMIDGDDCGAISSISEWQGKPKYSKKTCSIAALCATEPKLLDSGSKPDRGGGKPVTNHLSYGTGPASSYN
jgi:hypothetical protein